MPCERRAMLGLAVRDDQTKLMVSGVDSIERSRSNGG